MDSSGSFSELLQQAQQGQQHAKNELFELIYDELKQRAALAVRRKGPYAQATSLVHEAYLRLFKEVGQLDLKSRGYFFSAVIDQMTKVLDERIRKTNRRKDKLQPVDDPVEEYADQFIAEFEKRAPFRYEEMRDALKRLKKSRDKKKARRHQMLEYHYIGEMSIAEAGKLVGVASTIAYKEKELADAELYLAIIARQE
jgi:RNA polymerase sigma factor (TIGR02999 family)